MSVRAGSSAVLLLCVPPSPFKIGSGLLLRKPEVFSECKQRCSCSWHCTGMTEKNLEGFVCHQQRSSCSQGSSVQDQMNILPDLFFFYEGRASMCNSGFSRKRSAFLLSPVCDLSVAQLEAYLGSLKTSRGSWSLE